LNGTGVVRKSTLVMIAFAVVFGLLAVFVAQSWLNNAAANRLKSLETKKAIVPTSTIVVAAERLLYGTELGPNHLKEIAWPADALPEGAFAKVPDVLGAGKRVVLSPLEPNEPLLAVKITGPGQRATLSALVGEGMKAVTVRVNDVEGVGGFVLPGDRVDVVLTRQIDKSNATTEIVLQNARVLAVDQSAKGLARRDGWKSVAAAAQGGRKHRRADATRDAGRSQQAGARRAQPGHPRHKHLGSTGRKQTRLSGTNRGHGRPAIRFGGRQALVRTIGGVCCEECHM
jgi:Flp pilus assembly protein CpaB